MATAEGQDKQETGSSPALREQLAERLGDLCTQVRNRRKDRELSWLNNHAAWMAKEQGRAQYKSDDFKHYIPVARRAIERNVIRGTQMLMPSPDFFEVYPGDDFDLAAGRQAQAVRVFMAYLHTDADRIPARRNITQLFRCLQLYDRAIVKNTVQVIDVPVSFAGRIGRIQEVWPVQRVVDPFQFYVWPETVTSVTDAQIQFEDVMMPWGEYEEHVTKGHCDPIDRSELGKPEWPHHWKTRLAHQGLTEPDAVSQGIQPDFAGQGEQKASMPPQGFVALTEIWFPMNGAQCKAWLVWNVPKAPRITRLQRARYPIPPYRMALGRPIPGEHHTTGIMDDLEPLQVLYNDQVNQGEESRVIASVPPVVVDVNQVARADSLVFGPRKKWQMQSVEGAKVLNVPDVSLSAVRAKQETLALINSLGGGGGYSEGQPTRGMPRAGFAVTGLISLAMGDIKDLAEIIEQEIMTPSLGDHYRNTLMFVPRMQIMRVPGTADYPPATMTVEDLAGSWRFRWTGTLQSQDQQMRAQKLVGALTLLVKAEPGLNAQGFELNWPDLIKRAWRDGLGERGLENIVRPMSPDRLALMRAQALNEAGGPPPGPGGPSVPGSPGDAAAIIGRALAASPTEG